MQRRSIGVRELRQHASRFLREVESGDTIEVTDHGRPTALLVPIPGGTALERLAARGRLATATGDLLDLGPPLEPAAQATLPADTLARARADER